MNARYTAEELITLMPLHFKLEEGRSCVFLLFQGNSSSRTLKNDGTWISEFFTYLQIRKNTFFFEIIVQYKILIRHHIQNQLDFGLLSAQTFHSIFAQKYLRKCEDNYSILQNKYLHFIKIILEQRYLEMIASYLSTIVIAFFK